MDDEYRRLFGSRPMPDRRVTFEGGPWDGDKVDGMLATMLSVLPLFCVAADGRYEHYVRSSPEAFIHAGPCISVLGHPDCGHDHTDA